MSIIAVDETLCCKDGICAAVCPRLLIDMEGEAGFPIISAENELLCLACGHCEAVCPKGAIQVEGLPGEGCTAIDKALSLSSEQAAQFIRTRRSIRAYKEKAVEKQTMQKLIELARCAPTASNTQSVQWTVISDREKLHTFAEKTIELMRGVVADSPGSDWAKYVTPIISQWEKGYDGIMRGAPALVVASSPRQDLNGMVDSVIALTTLELAAPSLGLGTCWVGLLNFGLLASEELLSSLGLPEGHTKFYPMLVGYPKFKYHRVIERNAPVISWQ